MMQIIDVKVQYNDLPNHYFYQLDPDDARLIFDFFIVFSRFEFALKRCGYLKGNSNQAEPDWNKFCNDFQGKYDKKVSPEFQSAWEYYTTHPPMKQVVKDDQIVWKENKQGSDSEFRWILRSIRTVRNNLFHGGKFPYDQVRDNALLFHGLMILNEVIKYDIKLERMFTHDPT